MPLVLMLTTAAPLRAVISAKPGNVGTACVVAPGAVVMAALTTGVWARACEPAWLMAVAPTPPRMPAASSAALPPAAAARK